MDRRAGARAAGPGQCAGDGRSQKAEALDPRLRGDDGLAAMMEGAFWRGAATNPSFFIAASSFCGFFQ